MSAQTYTPDEAFNKIRTAVTGKGEESGRNTVMRALAAVNYRSAPRVIEGRHDGSNFRIYHWSGTPMGDILLVGGASVETDLIHGSELADTPKAGMIYVAGSVAGGKTMDKVQAYLQSKAVTRQAAKAQEAGVPPTRATSPKPRTAAAPRKPATRKPEEPKVEVKPAPPSAERAAQFDQHMRERMGAYEAESAWRSAHSTGRDYERARQRERVERERPRAAAHRDIYQRARASAGAQDAREAAAARRAEEAQASPDAERMRRGMAQAKNLLEFFKSGGAS